MRGRRNERKKGKKDDKGRQARSKQRKDERKEHEKKSALKKIKEKGGKQRKKGGKREERETDVHSQQTQSIGIVLRSKMRGREEIKQRHVEKRRLLEVALVPDGGRLLDGGNQIFLVAEIER